MKISSARLFQACLEEKRVRRGLVGRVSRKEKVATLDRSTLSIHPL